MSKSSTQVEKVKPKKVLSPYFCFTTTNVKKIVEKEGISYTAAVSKAAVLWNEMDEKAKQPYVKMHAQDQERYDREMLQFNKTGYFTNKDGVCSSTLKAKVKRSKETVKVEMPIVPKRVCTPYTFYVKLNAKSCMEKNKNCAMTQAASILSKEWNELSSKQKKPYVDLSAKDQERK